MSADSVDGAAGAAIRTRRLLAGFSQQEIADKMGVKQSAVTKWERGYVPMRLRDAVVLCRILGVTLGDLWDEPKPDRYHEGIQRGLELSQAAISRAMEQV